MIDRAVANDYYALITHFKAVLNMSAPAFFYLLLLAPCLASDADESLRVDVQPARLDQLIEASVNASVERLYTYRVSHDLLQDAALRVYVESDLAPMTRPLLVVVRNQRGVLSWQIPLLVPWQPDDGSGGAAPPIPGPPPVSPISAPYYSVNRTLCPAQDYPSPPPIATAQYLLWLEQEDHIELSLSTSSPSPVPFRAVLYLEKTFKVDMGVYYETEVSPSAPIVYQFDFPDDHDLVLLKLESPDDFCLTLSVQNVSCPVYDLDRTILFEGLHQTVDRKTGLTFTREQFPAGVFIVLVVKADDMECQGHNVVAPRNATCHGPCRRKRVKFSLETKITQEEYLFATFGALGMFASVYAFVLMLTCVLCIRKRQLPPAALAERGREDNNAADDLSDEPQPPTSAGAAATASSRLVESGGGDTNYDAIDTLSEDSSIDETDIDLLEDADFDKDVFRTKTFLYVADLARKSPAVLAKKSNLYHWNLLTIAIFYGLPVVQLMLTYQNVSNTTGNQDLCYYNFLCAHPFSIVTDFNHVYSNIGYVLLGTLFILLVWRREMMHQQTVRAHPVLDTTYGIPQHFGMYYAMGLALIMEGIMSGCYHVCPSHNNFQFDTAFMYTISILILLKIYQTRHPDINANAYTAFGALAFIIFVGVIGVLHGSVYFWIFFTSLHILSCLLLSLQIYYMGRWKLDPGIFRRFYLVCYNDLRALCGGQWASLRPMYPDRLVLLLIVNCVNWGLSTYGVTHLARQGGDFASFLLFIFMANVMLYTVFYILMKLRHGERITWQPASYIVLSFFTWMGSVYFFLNKSTTWVLRPAQSRHFNQECKLFHFYDNHDIWHFLSSASLFLSFMILLTLDDDLDSVRRDKIPVF